METNTKKKKTLTTALAVAVAALLLIGGGTFAYLQGQTKDVVNSFKTNQVTVDLSEASGNEYNIIPGTSETKDPVVTVDNTVDAYVFLTVMDGTDGLVEYAIDTSVWTKLEGIDGVDNVYYRVVGKNDDMKKLNVLVGQQVTYGYELENSDMMENGQLKEGINLTFKASAIQKDQFATVEDAYNGTPVFVAANDNDSLASALTAVQGKTSEISITNDIDTITGIKSNAGTDLTVDFNGNTVAVSNPVGSAGTVTYGMQLLKGSSNKFVGGTYKPESDSVQLLVQNYSNLTLEDMTLDTTSGSRCSYALSCNFGTTTITGNTNILTKSGDVALDVMHWVNTSYADGVTVIIDENMTGTIDGKIEVYKYTNGAVDYDDIDKAQLIIKGGTFKNTGLSLDQFKKFVADGYSVTETESGVYKVTAE